MHHHTYVLGKTVSCTRSHEFTITRTNKHVRTHANIYTYTHVHVHSYTPGHAQTRPSTPMHAHSCPFLPMQTHVRPCTGTRIKTYTYTYIKPYPRPQVCTTMHTCAFTHTHTHKHVWIACAWLLCSAGRQAGLRAHECNLCNTPSDGSPAACYPFFTARITVPPIDNPSVLGCRCRASFLFGSCHPRRDRPPVGCLRTHQRAEVGDLCAATSQYRQRRHRCHTNR